MTKRHTIFAVICLILAPMGTRIAHAQDKLPLQRVQTIPMPGVSGRMDHLGVDVEGGRLFAAALGNRQNTVEVIDLKAGKRTFSIRGQSMPQGVFYSADFKRFFVANGKDGTVDDEPWSLKERVERAHGSLKLKSVPGSTNVLISLPLKRAAA